MSPPSRRGTLKQGPESPQTNQYQDSEETLHSAADDDHIDELHLNQEDVHADAKITGKASLF
jgi:hypothetical protein